MNFKIKTVLTITLILFVVAPPIMAGELDSPGTPSSSSGMPTLQGIYDRLNTGASLSVSGSFAEPAAGPSATGVSLGNLTSVLPQPDNTNGLAPANAPNGKTFWGLRTDDGTWGPQTGSNVNVVDTISGDATSGNLLNGTKAWVDGNEVTGSVPAGSSLVGFDGNLVLTITDGLYSGSKTTTAQDADLISSNIKSGVNIFGVDGRASVVDTSSGNALAGNLPCGIKAWVDGAEVTGTRGCLPDTGQTTSYTTTLGEDHDYSIRPPSYTDNSNGTVTDNITGLVWQQQDDNITKIWDDANAYCQGITLGGKTDWRLPTKKELTGIVDYSAFNPAINIVFTNTNSSNYWSSTTNANNTTNAWLVYFYNCYVNYYPKENKNYVRCVRGG